MRRLSAVKGNTVYDDRVGLMRRYYATIIDIILLLLIIAPIVNPFLQFVDSLLFVKALLLIMSLIILYFWGFTRFVKRTVGQFFLGYKVIATETGTPHYFKRLIFGLVAWMLSGITVIEVLADFDCIYWWDRKSNTRAVSTRT